MEKVKCSNLRLTRQFVFDVFILLLMVQTSLTSNLKFEVGGATSHAVENGRKRMEELTQKARLPSDGDCWKSALEDLQLGCKLLTEDIQSRMALRFTSCFTEMLGNPPLMCEPSTPTKDCLKGLDVFAKSTFREYFLHTQDMCYYLRQEIWQESTNIAVNRLTDAAEDVTKEMEQQKQIQEQIYISQQESLKVQSNLKKDNEDLYNAVVKVKDVFDDFSETAKEHQVISSEIFDKLSRMQKLVFWIQGEMSMVDMILWYFAAMLFGYFATTSERTRSARFWLILLFMITILFEKVGFNYLSKPESGFDLGPEDIQWYITCLRNGAALGGAFIILISAALYQDAATDSKNALKNMQFTLDSVAQFIMDQKQRYENNQNGGNISQGQILDGTIQEDSSDEDSFSNYSSDDSSYKLELELKDLQDNEDNENNENVQPEGTPGSRILSRIFSRGDSVDRTRSPLKTDGTRRYNLRERSATPRENPLVYQESATAFAKAVKKRTTGQRQPANPSYFSSDDDEQ
ncbi:Protein GAMETE EXPRESSED 1 [Orchesella cincta]|uniref:Protein GAMETE EXPRESSED 1 n=1 Tax=Orchesella cincta TaxID=48709 RepID=A0A1D2MJA8_ORCCI|nr:Protein GAMETE EXPRESSED 1 [Orchesella cincta]